MKKIVFTQFKKLSKSPALRKQHGIDMAEYFEVYPNTEYGHRTWMDFEAMFWFVETKFSYGVFKKFI